MKKMIRAVSACLLLCMLIGCFAGCEWKTKDGEVSSDPSETAEFEVTLENLAN